MPNQREKIFHKMIQETCKHMMPIGRRIFNKPELNKEIIDLIDQRNNIRQTNPSSNIIQTIDNLIRQLTNKQKKTKWYEFLSTFNNKVNSKKKLWQNNKEHKSRDQPITQYIKSHTSYSLLRTKPYQLRLVWVKLQTIQF
ncbi:hypothetical protein HELRODRAFT_165368 [Helobdella robusta]|uniref:Uncharacterized protein n=1 Tax=Helobdella robusta TaxID=6412 RepID=T1EWN3_HELRO|nr:hypothetical protein HELRODRAFT_165368 [Helobdella robusta]ESN91343.1 hypothetical protein HELRODRAFT_165368 [Helobdella robusta]